MLFPIAPLSKYIPILLLDILILPSLVKLTSLSFFIPVIATEGLLLSSLSTVIFPVFSALPLFTYIAWLSELVRFKVPLVVFLNVDPLATKARVLDEPKVASILPSFETIALSR